MKVKIFYLVYFIIKGTVSLFIYDDCQEFELTEIKKYRNFGEIEMCLNKKLIYNIKIKSKICEMFILKKVDFLKLSVNHRDHIEAFLNLSINKYLQFKNTFSNKLDFEEADEKNETRPNKEMVSIQEISREEEESENESNKKADTNKEKITPNYEIISNKSSKVNDIDNHKYVLQTPLEVTNKIGNELLINNVMEDKLSSSSSPRESQSNMFDFERSPQRNEKIISDNRKTLANDHHEIGEEDMNLIANLDKKIAELKDLTVDIEENYKMRLNEHFKNIEASLDIREKLSSLEIIEIIIDEYCNNREYANSISNLEDSNNEDEPSEINLANAN